MQTIDIHLMAKHYLQAAIWADAPEGANPRITKQAQKYAEHTCAKFTGLIGGELLPELLEYPDYWAHPDCGGRIEAALGHDLYLTSAGHGVGFWCRDVLPDCLRRKLSDLCCCGKQIPEPELSFYSGWMYL